MKNSFNFLQFANWLIVCRENIQKICDEVVNEQITKEEALKKLYIEKEEFMCLKKFWIEVLTYMVSVLTF